MWPSRLTLRFEQDVKNGLSKYYVLRLSFLIDNEHFVLKWPGGQDNKDLLDPQKNPNLTPAMAASINPARNRFANQRVSLSF